jgi:TetR/AcrR family transcriptional repressor of nem operon
MKVSRATAAEHRATLLDQAGRLLRRKGIEGVSVAEVTRAAGLTHGAFYGHFPSKAELVAESVASALVRSAGHWRRRAALARAAGRDGLSALIDAYLTEAHRDAPEAGCALPALGPEVARAGDPMAAALEQGATALADVLAEEIALLHPGLSAPVCRARGLAMLAALTGGLVLARALAADPAASRATLAATARLARMAADMTEPLD